MHKTLIFLAVLLIPALNAARAADEQPLKTRVVAVGLFKNGLAAVKREVKLPGAGTFLIEDAPDPVHGTWWVESDTDVETRTAVREVTVPLPQGETPDLQRALAGKKVTIHFRDGQIPPAAGIVQVLPTPRGDAAWDRAYAQPMDYSYHGWRSAYGSWGGYSASPGAPGAAAAPARFLLLKSDAGETYVDVSMIAYLRAEGSAETVRQRRPVLLLTLPAEAKPATVVLTYLSKGLAWAPSYKVDISDPKSLSLTQGVVVKNEFGDLEETEVQLITGFPNVQFAHVSSPLNLRTTWTAFFQQLNQRFAAGHAAMGNVMSQQAVTYNEPGNAAQNLAAMPVGEGVDLYYHSIGKRSLKEGEALALSVAAAQAPYERIIEWRVPDIRDEWGRRVERGNYQYYSQADPERFEDEPWDAVRFRNPLGFPMTTAPATVVAKGRFNGQSMTRFVNAGEETTVRVNKALSVRTRSVETEGEAGRDIVYWGGRTFRKVPVNGELALNNHRNEEVKLVLRRQFSGELVTADGDPKKVLREEGVYSVNARRELTWELTLKPGEERTLKYQYTLLVLH